MDNKLKLLWLVFAFIVLLFTQQCTAIFISHSNNVEVREKDVINIDSISSFNRIDAKTKNKNISFDTANIN